MDTDQMSKLLQDFWERIKGVEKVFRKKDIKALYKDKPLSKSELDFLYKSYVDGMSAVLSSTDSPDSLYNPDRYRTPEETEIATKNVRDIISKLCALGVINRSMPRMEALAIVMKYKDSECFICKEIAPLCCSCKDVKYCSKACQKADWANHKTTCSFKNQKKN